MYKLVSIGNKGVLGGLVHIKVEQWKSAAKIEYPKLDQDTVSNIIFRSFMSDLEQLERNSIFNISIIFGVTNYISRQLNNRIEQESTSEPIKKANEIKKNIQQLRDKIKYNTDFKRLKSDVSDVGPFFKYTLPFWLPGGYYQAVDYTDWECLGLNDKQKNDLLAEGQLLLRSLRSKKDQLPRDINKSMRNGVRSNLRNIEKEITPGFGPLNTVLLPKHLVRVRDLVADALYKENCKQFMNQLKQTSKLTPGLVAEFNIYGDHKSKIGSVLKPRLEHARVDKTSVFDPAVTTSYLVDMKSPLGQTDLRTRGSRVSSVFQRARS